MIQIAGKLPAVRQFRRALIAGAIVVIGLCCIAMVLVVRGSRQSTPFRILATPENQALEPILRQYAGKSSHTNF